MHCYKGAIISMGWGYNLPTREGGIFIEVNEYDEGVGLFGVPRSMRRSTVFCLFVF